MWGTFLAMRTLSRINVSPVKGMALHHPGEVELGPAGISENRRFYLVDEWDELFSAPAHGPLVRIRPDHDPAACRLRLTFPDGVEVSGGTDALGEAVVTDFYGRPVPAHPAVRNRCREVESGARNVDSILTGKLLPEISRQILGRMAEGQGMSQARVSVDASGNFQYEIE